MIANLTRGAKTASLHLPADRFQIASVLSYLGVDRLDDYELPCEGQDSSGIMVSLEPTGIAERNIAELCRNEKVSLGRLNSKFCSLFKLPYEQQLGVMDQISSQNPVHFDDFRKAIDKLVYKHGSASPEDRGHLQAPVSPRERSIQKQNSPARF